MFKFLQEGGIASALSHANFRRFAIGDLVSLLGNWVQRVGVGWLTWQLTESGTWLGIVVMAELIPSILLGPIGGAFADKANRLKIAIVTQLIMIGQAGGLAILTLGGWIEIWSLLALMATRGLVNAWSHPARQALVPSLVPPKDLPAAVAMNSVFFNTARFIGPALAGVLIAKWDIGYAFLFNAATFVVFFIVLISIHIPYPEAMTKKHRSLFGQLSEGFRYIIGHPGIGPILLLLSAGALLARPITDLLPGYSGAVFDSGATGLALMTSAMGIGSMIGAFTIAQRGHVSGLTRYAVRGTFIMALTLLIFAFAPSLWTALIVLPFLSFAMTITGISCQSLVQNAVEGNLRGRVISVYSLIFHTGPAAGALIIGTLSEHINWHWPLACSAGLCFLAWLVGRKKQNAMAAFLEK
ncbi:MAG: MFS family permease [Alphaproteobacteria bacterium]|jgi:MFS family permease